MNTTAEVQYCPNCSAPLELDDNGNCHWCHVHVTLQITGASVAALDGLTPEQQASITNLDKHNELRLPEGSVYLPLPVFPLLSCLNAAAYDPAIQAFLSTPDRVDSIRALAEAVEAAGQRLQDAGVEEDDVIGRGEKIYSPEELWIFELLTDLLARLKSVEGIERDTRSMLIENVSGQDDMWQKRVRKRLKAAGDGPEQFRPLRASLPRRH